MSEESISSDAEFPEKQNIWKSEFNGVCAKIGSWEIDIFPHLKKVVFTDSNEHMIARRLNAELIRRLRPSGCLENNLFNKKMILLMLLKI